ncbi:calcium/calmodulin-dependent 3',5'-cyclic nucleotide phosphodiesterase 1A-like [Lytechinus variegatus]|uniref:calcium/calmodulin-dependent 3',5'-cyclic nucleotide phosphodiesterase 1A-like n=1 Tax=Lytechinus variegatus TaxID=7654 RepID=UPI001BB102CD|nr:calcium/calmodulin-dependent 3',5'-cyclic nucleotide phosphodiesterase 1A-like [Lytechinus variegatus]
MEYRIIKKTDGKRRLRRQDSQSMDEESLASIDLEVSETMPPATSPQGAVLAALRLRSLVLRLEREEVSKKYLKENLEYAASVLDTLKQDETRYHYHEEEDDLSEVTSDEVPEQVRHWLTSTFSRQSTKSRLGDEKPRFRSIVQALRTGLFIDRMFRRTSATAGTVLPAKVIQIFKTIDDWSFDIFSLDTESDGHALKCLATEVLSRYDLQTKFKIPHSVLGAFLDAMELGYSKYGNPYHNLLHAADVTQTVHHMLARMGLVHWLSDLEIFASLLAAIIHDFEHTGTTNAFHVNTKSDMAMFYNDRAVLENHHISSSFRLMRDDERNILANLSKEEYTELRNLVIDMVLATDMSFHFQQIKQMKAMISTTEALDKPKVMALTLHCADISHPSKEWKFHYKWTTLLIREFFRQGDREREMGLPISPLCDRNSTLLAESQIGFIDFIVDPSMNVCGDMIDRILREELQSASNSPSADSVVRNKRNSIPMARPCSAPRSASVPAPANNNSMNDRDRPSSPGRVSLGRRNSIPVRCLRSWHEHLHKNKAKWRDLGQQEVNTGAKVLDIDEDPTDQKPNKDVFHKNDSNDNNTTRKTSNGIEEEEVLHDQATTSSGAAESSGSAQTPGRQGSGER